MGLKGFLGFARPGRIGGSFGSVGLGRACRFDRAGAFAGLVNHPHTNPVMARASTPIVGLAVVSKSSSR